MRTSRDNANSVVAEIIRFVVANGRVSGKGQEWFDSLEAEIEFEASERGYDDLSIKHILNASHEEIARMKL